MFNCIVIIKYTAYLIRIVTRTEKMSNYSLASTDSSPNVVENIFFGRNTLCPLSIKSKALFYSTCFISAIMILGTIKAIIA